MSFRRLLLLAAVLLPFPAVAAEDPAPAGPTSFWDRWEFVLGGGAALVPEYEGSDDMKVQPLPIVSATYDDWLQIATDGATADVYRSGPFTFSATLGYEGGRDDDDDKALHGLGDVDFGVTTGARAAAEFGPATVSLEVEKTLGGSDGLRGIAGVELGQAVTPRLRLGVGASVTLADDNRMQSYFGVDRKQAQRSGYRRYDADAGPERVDLEASALLNLDDSWFLKGQAGLGLLVGDAADSPITQRKAQPSGYMALGFRF